MTEPDGGYDLKPVEKAPAAPAGGDGVTSPKPGEPGFVPPVPIIEKADPVVDYQGNTPDPDVEKHKGMAILGYICFLFPLLLAPASPYARFHANQGLLSFIFWCVAVVANVGLGVAKWILLPLMTHDGLEILRMFFSCMVFLVQFGSILVAIGLTLYGIIQAANGEKKGLPLIGQITLLK